MKYFTIALLAGSVTVLGAAAEPADARTRHAPVTQPAGGADLAVTGKAGKLSRGKKGKYRLIATNYGPSNASKVKLTLKAPKYHTLTKVSGTGCKVISRNKITCLWPSLAAGKTIKVTATLKTSKSKKAKRIRYATITIDSDTPDPFSGNDTTTIKSKVT